MACGKLDDTAEKIRQEIMIFLTTELMNHTESRGKDAAGVAAMFENGEYMVIKSGMPSPQLMTTFTERDNKTYKNFLNVCRDSGSYVKSYIGHCRKASVGNTWDNVNNHPIRVGDIIGVHNGTLKNHDRIFEILSGKRDGEVDSESIFRLFNHFTNEGKEPFTIDNVKEVGRKLDGSFAVIAANSNNPFQIALLRDARPVELAIVKDYGILMIASEKKFMEMAMFNLNMASNLFNLGIPATKFTKSSVLFDDIFSMHAGIVDLTVDVNEDTKVADIVKTERIGLTEDEWKEKTKTHHDNYSRTYNSGFCNQNKNLLTDGKSDANDKKTSSESGQESGTKTAEQGTQTSKQGNESDENIGMVWSRTSKKFSSIARTGGTKGIKDDFIDSLHGAEITPIQKKIKEVTTNGEDPVEIELKSEIDNDRFDNHSQSTCKLNEIDADNDSFEKGSNKEAVIKQYHMEQDPVVAHKKPSGVAIGQVVKTSNTIDRKALDAAYKYKGGLEKYESDDELAMKLEMQATTLRAIPSYTLCNRHAESVALSSYYEGYLQCAEDMKGGVVEPELPKKSAEMHIRILKVLMNMLIPMVKGTMPSEVENAVSNAMNSGVELTSEKYKSVISTGDLKKHRILRWIGDMISDKEKR